jgi:hypothetical protein
MSIKAGLSAGALAVGFGGFSLVLPAPASADQDLTGTYAYLVTEEVDRGAPVEINTVRTWTVTPCGPGCAHVNSSADRASGGSGAYDGDLQLVDGVWQMTVARPDLSVCNDGRRLPGTVSYSMDPATLTGTANGEVAEDCDGAPGSFQDQFMLTHTGSG